MNSALRIFFHAPDTKPFAVLICVLISGVSQALSLGALLPLVTQISGNSDNQQSSVTAIINNFLGFLGLTPGIGILIMLVVIALVLKSLTTFAALSYAGSALARVSTSFRARLLSALFAARWSYFVSHRTGRLANAISNDCTRAGDAYFAAARLIAFIVQAVFSILVAILISPQLAVAGVLIGAVIIFLLKKLVQLGRKAGYKQAGRTADLVTYVSDAMGNIKPIRTMERKQPFEAYFSRRIDSLRRALFTRQIARQGLSSAQESLQAIIAGLGIYFAATYWQIPLPELVVSAIIFMQMVSMMSKIQAYTQQVGELEGSYIHVQDMISEAEAAIEPDPGNKTPQLTKHCQFENVSFSHEPMGIGVSAISRSQRGKPKPSPTTEQLQATIEEENKANKIPVIKNANLVIPAGGITVLQGSSGAGKTTLIDLLIGLHQPSSGKILIDDVPLTEISLKAWRQMIGYVPQELSLLHGSIRQNITLGEADISDADLTEAMIMADAESFINALPHGLDSDVGEMGGKLSGGQRQRIALARALLMKPRLLVLDEVTSALDPETELDICTMIAGLAGRYTIVAITHRPAWTKIATNLYKVDAGEVEKMPLPKQNNTQKRSG